MKKLTFLSLFIALSLFSQGQVGVGTTMPNDKVQLDISSNDKGILIPRLTEAERDAQLADNDISTVYPANTPALAAPTTLQVSTMIFNTSANEYQYWDGTLWRSLATIDPGAGGANDGVVRLDGQNGSLTNKPVYVIPSGTTWVTVGYNAARAYAAFPTSDWPPTQPATDASFYNDMGTPGDLSDDKFLENNVEGQVHIWRINVTWSKGNASAAGLQARLFNPLSGFETINTAVVPGNANSGTATMILFSIADLNSIGNGYQIQIRHDSQQIMTVSIVNIARISLSKS